jgi:lambda family phage portal protein
MINPFRRQRSEPDPEKTKRLARALEFNLPRHGARRFDAAVSDRLTASWVSGATAIDAELRGQLDPLRNRSRDLFKNNEYAAKFGRMVRNNVVGPDGFMLQARVTDPSGSADSLANKTIEAAWWRWMRPANCEASGKHSFVGVCNQVALALARDGEFLVRKVRGRGLGEFGFQLQLIDVARLDTTLNRDAREGLNAIVMGVELDPSGRALFYHIKTASSRTGRATRERIPASEIIHGFIPIETEQTRGVPWMHAAMLRMHDLNGYRGAAVIAARVGASKMGVWETPDGLPPPGASEGDEPGSYITEVDPGHFDFAPPGYKLTTYDPTYPHDQFDSFTKSVLRGIASGIGVAYNALANDLEGVNFSSIRAGVLEEREHWMAIQNWMISAFLDVVYEEWLAHTLLSGGFVMPNGAVLPAAKLDKFREHVWQPRRWPWVDPLKDIQASVMAIDNMIASPQQIAAQSGRDIEDVLDDIVAFKKLLAERGLQAVAAKPKQSPASIGADTAADENA